MEKVLKKQQDVQKIKNFLSTQFIEPQDVNLFLAEINNSLISEKQKADKLLLRPDIQLNPLKKSVPVIAEILSDFAEETIEQAEIQIKYQAYIDKEKELATRMKEMEELAIPEQFDYKKIRALGIEAREKLSKIRPQTLGQASRISGINPTDVQILMVFMGR
jgi:tRNA uridine 5-carboxymethylaminomethyl modification enzyme